MTTPTPAHGVATMEAGLELDALVAERVMGWAWWRSSVTGRRCIYAPGRNPEWMQTPADMTESLVTDWGARLDGIQHYSTDIAAAWQLVGHLDARFHAVIKTPFEPGANYHAGFTPHSTTGWNGRPDFRAEALTAPLAICRAALLAVRS